MIYNFYYHSHDGKYKLQLTAANKEESRLLLLGVDSFGYWPNKIENSNDALNIIVKFVFYEKFKADLMVDFKIKDEDTFFDRVFGRNGKKLTKIKAEYARLLNLVNSVVLDAFSNKVSYAATEIDTDEVFDTTDKVVH